MLNLKYVGFKVRGVVFIIIGFASQRTRYIFAVQ